MHTVPQLPIEVLSHITALISPAYHPTTDEAEADSSTPPDYILDALDPHPIPPYGPINTIAAFSRSSHGLLEASRPWLWEDVDVRSGRGWLAVVNALTEEVADQPPIPLSLLAEDAALTAQKEFPIPLHPHPGGIPLSPISPDAHLLPELDMPISHDAGLEHTSHEMYASTSSSGILQRPGSSMIGLSTNEDYYDPSAPHQPYSPCLLTPPGSRNSSPRPDLIRHHTHTPTSSQGARDYSPASSGSEASHTGLSRHNTITASLPLVFANSRAAAAARLRGRSRSPRRSVGFDTEGISAVLERSRSVSAHGSVRIPSTGTWPKRFPLERRRSSLSRAKTMSDGGYDEDDEADEEDDVVSELAPPTPSKIQSIISPTRTDLTFDESQSNCNPDLLPPPGPYIRHLSFNNFRTIGSGRTQDEAVRGRFVTAGRMEGVIKNCPNLISVCLTEYVDSSLSFPVIEDLLFRGYRQPKAPRRMSITNNSRALSRQRSISVDPNPFLSPMTTLSQLDPPRPDYVPYEDENEQEKWLRRSKFTPLQALDFTGCVSSVFSNAIREFCVDYLDPDHDDHDDEDRGRSRHRPSDAPSSTEDEDDIAFARPPKRISRRTPRFSAMKRLSLRACTTMDPPLLHDLVLAFPNLTHLDISNTRAPTSLIQLLTDNPPRNMRLEALSLARCPRLDPTAMVNFLVLSPVCRSITQLNLYMNPTQSNTITASDLDRLLSAPCIKSGQLRYLDLSSTGMTPYHLSIFPAQPRLLSFGLSHIPRLALAPIAEFLLARAPNVEILTLSGTALESALSGRNTSLQTTMELHAQLINPLTKVPFSLASLSLNMPSMGPDLRPGATHLRVIELSSPIRRLIADGGSGEWKVVKSKGGRGWYVDTSAGWIADPDDKLLPNGKLAKTFVRHLPTYHPKRDWLAGLATASGRVGSAVGWHSRKMEIVRGFGMLGREEGMAGVGGFAFDE